MAPRIDLATAGTSPSGARAVAAPVPVPVVVRLSLVELVVLRERCGAASLPIDLTSFAEPDPGAEDLLSQRLTGGAPSPGQRARARLRAALDEARERPGPSAARLVELGMLDEAGTPVPDVVTALGLLSAPEVLLVQDLAVTRGGGEDRLRCWFAIGGSQVVQLSTASGLVVELSWYDVGGLPAALARAATVEAAAGSEERGSDLGSPLVLPFELFSDGTEAVRRGRPDLLAELVRIAPARTLVAGVEVPSNAVAPLVTALEESATGRLRVLVTVPTPEAPGRRTAGVVSWLRVGGGWRSLLPLVHDDVPLVEITSVTPRDLARAVGPVLAEVVR